MLQEYLAQEYVRLVDQYYPEAGKVLRYCYVRVLEYYVKRLQKSSYYLGIYYPKEKFFEVKSQQDTLKEIAENMGLTEVIYVDANRIVRDPLSQIKKQNPRFWLELYWISTQFFVK
ncbi:conserved hypothetical protein [Gloeothece citriformis PCC 7424]|uniref:Uncharacterized protein n=1 Tax=Gloeothece citriformis (strain PCC 7424) TaxID=65393 RepID=B7KG62_GLOC7|nr:hypothetical protein [Gloeothece citriformis]ACK70533.1 conserved hypothetical protein [Gloeothece citriformis PCC 7424]